LIPFARFYVKEVVIATGNVQRETSRRKGPRGNIQGDDPGETPRRMTRGTHLGGNVPGKHLRGNVPGETSKGDDPGETPMGITQGKHPGKCPRGNIQGDPGKTPRRMTQGKHPGE